MVHKDDAAKSINETVHKVKVINPTSFKISSTLDYTPYESSGLVKQIKSIKEMYFLPLSKVNNEEPPFDPNMLMHDFEKMDQIKWLHICYNILNEIVGSYHNFPWNYQNSL